MTWTQFSLTKRTIRLLLMLRAQCLIQDSRTTAAATTKTVLQPRVGSGNPRAGNTSTKNPVGRGGRRSHLRNSSKFQSLSLRTTTTSRLVITTEDITSIIMISKSIIRTTMDRLIWSIRESEWSWSKAEKHILWIWREISKR